MSEHIARYSVGNSIHFGLLEGDTLRRLAGLPFAGLELSGETDRLADARLLCPVDRPRIFGVGLNYVLHIAETNSKTPQRPMLFMKPSTAAIGPGDHIVYPPEARNLHFEGELAVVIGRRTRRVAEAEALHFVLGYTCANDLSERVIQAEEMSIGCLLVGKGFDTFCPLGPVIATELDSTDMLLEAFVNGIRRQSSNTSDLLFSVAQLVSYLSQAITLLPGDVIITGTPSGIGPVLPGDVVDIAIAGIGTLSNPVVAERLDNAEVKS